MFMPAPCLNLFWLLVWWACSSGVAWPDIPRLPCWATLDKDSLAFRSAPSTLITRPSKNGLITCNAASRRSLPSSRHLRETALLNTYLQRTRWRFFFCTWFAIGPRQRPCRQPRHAWQDYSCTPPDFLDFPHSPFCAFTGSIPTAAHLHHHICTPHAPAAAGTWNITSARRQAWRWDAVEQGDYFAALLAGAALRRRPSLLSGGTCHGVGYNAGTRCL